MIESAHDLALYISERFKAVFSGINTYKLKLIKHIYLWSTSSKISGAFGKTSGA